MESYNAGATRGRRAIQILYDNIRNLQESDAAMTLDELGMASVLDFSDLDPVRNDADWLQFLCDYNE